MLRSPLAVAGAVVTAAATLLVVGPAAAAPAQQVCRPELAVDGVVCFYTGPGLTGREFDLTVPVTDELPVPTDGDCADLPEGFGAAGSVTNDSPDTLYVLPASCVDSHAGVHPAAIVGARFAGDVHALGAVGHSTTPSVRMCGPDLTLNLTTLGCVYAH